MGRERVVLAACCAWLVACAAPPPEGLGIVDGRLADCPSSPNCVATDASDPDHRTDPFVLALPPELAWPLVVEAVGSLEGATLVDVGTVYVHARCVTALMGYVDDLEVLLQPERGRLSVRSASRTGWYDMGANRERVWELRRRLEERDVLP